MAARILSLLLEALPAAEARSSDGAEDMVTILRDVSCLVVIYRNANNARQKENQISFCCLNISLLALCYISFGCSSKPVSMMMAASTSILLL